MTVFAFIICIVVIALTAVLLFKKYNPQGILLLSGMLMVALSLILGTADLEVSKPTGSAFFDIFRYVEEKFLSNFGKAGLMIMVIGGYVTFMNKIKATDMLVHISIKPLSVFKKHPYLAAVLAIPIGQLLFIATPSAAGVGLLLVATLYPILVNLGVSKLTALSVISAATLFDQGPSSANTTAAAGLIGITPTEYFLHYQLPCVIPTVLILMVVMFFHSRRCDRRDVAAGKDIYAEKLDEAERPDAPVFYALLPLLPIIVLLSFPKVSTTVAMLVSLVAALACEAVRKRNLLEVTGLFGTFWQGMGSVFASVVTLIICAEVFSGGLVCLGFVDSLVAGTTGIGLGGTAISIVITAIVFLAAMLMGSGNAAFFSFGPLLPDISAKLGVSSAEMILPAQMAAGMGRAASPIAGVIVAICGVAGVSPLELAKRNTPPLAIGIACLTAIHFFL